MRPRDALLLALLAAPLGGCGDDGPVMPDTSKTVPVVPEQYQHRDLDAWLGVGGDASADEKEAQAFALAALVKEPIRATPILLRLLQDDDASVRLAAIIAAGRLAPPSARLATVLCGFLGDEREPLRRHARRAVGELGETAVPALAEALGDERVRVRWGALSALARVGAPAAGLAPRVEALAREAEDASVRSQARITLALLGADGARRCAAFLRDEDPVVRREAERALAFSGPQGVMPLLGVVGDDEEVPAALAASVVREIALRGALGEHTQAAVTVLVDALARAGPVRFAATDALLAMRGPARATLEARKGTAEGELREVIEHVLEMLEDAGG